MTASLYTDSITYASTLSSLTSSLGLTESPLPPEKKTMALLEDVRDRSGDLRRMAVKTSRQDLREGVAKRVQSIETLKTGTKQGMTSQRSSAKQLRQALQPAAPQLSSVSKARDQIATPTRPTHTAQPKSHSPARTEASIADDWDAELRRDAQYPSIQRPPKKASKEIRDEWERGAMWDQREAGRDEEERTRRDAQRQIGKSSPCDVLISLPARYASHAYSCCTHRCDLHPHRCPAQAPPLSNSRIRFSQST